MGSEYKFKNLLLSLNFGAENCDGNCAANTTGTNVVPSTDTAAVDTADKTITLNDSENTPDLVVMSGPLSTVYTNALGVYFAKKDIMPEEVDETEGQVVSETTAAESQANDVIMSNVLSEVSKSQDILKTEANSSIVLVNQFDNFDEDPDAVVLQRNVDVVTDPETVQEITDVAGFHKEENTDTEVVLMVTVQDTSVSDLQDAVTQETVNLTEDAAIQAAVESIYAQAPNLKVVVGVKGLAQWLSSRKK